MPRAVRLPLEIGVSALNDLALGVLILPFSVAIFAIGLAATIGIFVEGIDGDAVKVTVVIVLVGLIGAVYSVRLVIRAWRGRPADVVFGDAALSVDGGRAHGFSLAYDAIERDRCSVARQEIAEFGASVAGTDKVYRLTLHGRVLADADAAEEIASLHEVLAAVHACAPGAPPAAAPSPPAPSAALAKHERKKHRRDDDAQAPAVPAAPAAPAAPIIGVLACGACGGFVAPSEQPEVPCPHCAVAFAMPADVRERVRAAAVVAAGEPKVALAVEALLDQPGARSTTLLLTVSLVLIAGAWPLCVWSFIHLYHADTLTFWRGFALAILPLLLIADGFFLSRARLVNRNALATLVLSFGARPPASPGAPLTCRACAAPLPAGDQTVVRCVFCDAANVTGVDLRALAGRTTSSQDSLATALAARAKARLVWRLRTLASLPLFALTVWILRTVLAKHH